MMKAALGIFYRTALNRQNDFSRSPLTNGHDLAPIDYAVPTRTAQHSLHFSAIKTRRFLRNVFGMKAYNSVDHLTQPLEGIVPTEKGITRVKVDSDARCRYEF
jgi:hypothetical protein